MRPEISSLALLCGLAMSVTPCRAEADIDKERVAIKAVLEEEKDAFFARDSARMAETWVHGPAVMKLYVSAEGETRFAGWDAVSAHDRQNVSSGDMDLSHLKLTFSEVHVVVSGSSAWAVTKARWEGTAKGEKVDSTQARVHVLQKVDGKWKLVLMAICAVPPRATEAVPSKP